MNPVPPNPNNNSDIAQPSLTPSSEVGSGLDSHWRAMFEMQQKNMMQLIEAIRTPAVAPQITLPEINPELPDTDPRAWCDTIDICLDERPLEGASLIIALSKALKGNASSWLSQISHAGMTWQHFRDLFLARYASTETLAASLVNIHNGRPKEGECLAAYASRLMTTLLARWKNRSHEEIATSYVLAHVSQFDSRLNRLAFTSEITSRNKLLQEIKASASLKRKFDRSTGDGATDAKRFKPQTSTMFTCHKCGKPGHKAVNCRSKFTQPAGAKVQKTTPAATSSGSSKRVTCFRCGEAGHISTNCRGTAGGASSSAGSAANATAERRVDSCEIAGVCGQLEQSGMIFSANFDITGKPPLAYFEKKREEMVVNQCTVLKQSVADIDTVTVYPTFEFQPSWVRSKEFWDKSFENRYEKLHNDSNRPRLKVFLVPHSHNDPGWLKTFEQYFEWKTKNIINNIVSKLHQYPNMTFIWTEISFLNAWWEGSHPVKQKLLKKLVKDGRLEITTGGWVMPDEACTHIYALIDQFIEGHQWVKTNLGVNPKTGWSIDPFGHGATVPHLLDKSGLEGTIIQRIHYAWKQWLAQRQIEEFYWIAGWATTKPSMIVHNHPFDIYSILSTCGPHPSICRSFDFRNIPGEYTVYKHEEITEHNLESKAKTLVEEYERIGSLTPHNVVLVPLGDDFRYEYSVEFDAQYENYMKMFNYINSHKEIFNADVQFGTPLDYFNAMKERHHTIPTLKGDFFVYSDIFMEGRPAYWSGYFTTRPYLKILARQFEHQLRSAEILFTLVSNYIKQAGNHGYGDSERKLEKFYEQLIFARRNLGLFQHHDAITGTSKSNVMQDYGTKLFTSLYHCIRLQETALTTIMIPDHKMHSQNILQSEVEWETYGKPARKLQVSFVDKKNIILFNPLAEIRTEIVTLKSNTSNIRVYDTHYKKHVMYQIAPSLDVHDNGQRVVSDASFNVMFVATVPPLAAITYKLQEHTNTSNHCVIFCNSCVGSQTSSVFSIQKMKPGDIQLENDFLKVLINRNSGLLRQIYRKELRKRTIIDLKFGAYQSAQRHSGAYLFMPDYDSPEKNVLHQKDDPDNTQEDNVLIVAGPISSEVTTMYLPLLVHSVRIYNIKDPILSQAVLLETWVDFGSPPKNRETELFMRFETDIQNGDNPEFYTDQNGFQYQKRVKVNKLGIEANYYPITTMAWLQDEETRLTLLTSHAQGASAFEPGRLEVMLDRRTLYDDTRGIGEGLVDNKPTVFQNLLLVETMPGFTRPKRDTSEKGFRFVNERRFGPNQNESPYQVPSQTADFLSRSLNYPVNVYLLDTSEVGDVDVKAYQSFLMNFPAGIHLVNLRTITDKSLEQFPTTDSFMVLHRPGYTCAVGEKPTSKSNKFTTTTRFNGLTVKNITGVSLTGLKTFKTLKGLSDIHLDPMEVKTYKIRF